MTGLKKERVNEERSGVPPDAPDSNSSEGLLKLYLALSPEQRQRQFVDTARAAEISGRSQRTIVDWISRGAIQAVRIGKRKYQVELDSLHHFLEHHAEDEADSTSGRE